MIKDTEEGQTHSYGDGCIPPHSTPTDTLRERFIKTRVIKVLKEDGYNRAFINELADFFLSELNQRQQRLVEEIEKLPYFMHGEYKKEFFVIRKDKAIEIIKKNIN